MQMPWAQEDTPQKALHFPFLVDAGDAGVGVAALR